MLSTICRNTRLIFFAMLGIMLLQPISSAAKCGGVDYSWGADALANAHDYTVTMMLYVVYLAYAIAAIVAIIGALQIYFKMFKKRWPHMLKYHSIHVVEGTENFLCMQYGEQ